MTEYDYVFKYLVLGGAEVGKYSLIDRFSSTFSSENDKNKEGLYFQ